MSLDEGPVLLSRDELGFLQFVSNLTPEPESPLARLPTPGRADETRAGREALITRRLVNARTLRPNRDLHRRLLVVSEPDAHVRLESISGSVHRVVLDVYERAGALVRLDRPDGGHQLFPPEDAIHLREQITRLLPVRRSSGDFIRIELSAEEYLAFCLLGAKTEAPRARSESERALAPRLERGMGGLVEKDLAVRRPEEHQLRPFLSDLGQALAARRRMQLTRTDYGVSDWLVRDVTFIVVQGSVFQLHVRPRSGIVLAELDGIGLERLLFEVLEPPMHEDEPRSLHESEEPTQEE